PPPVAPPTAVPANAQVIETRRPLLIEDAATTTLIPRQWVQAFGLKSCLIVPMILQDRVIGVMTLDYCERPTRFQDWQSDLAMAIAGQLSFALENTRLYAEAQDRLKETRTLLNVGQVFSQAGPTDHAIRRMAAEVGRAFGADMVGVYLVDERRERLLPSAGYTLRESSRGSLTRRPLVLERSPRRLRP